MSVDTTTQPNPVNALEPVFVDADLPGHTTKIALGVANPSASDLRAALEFLARELSPRATVSLAITEQGFAFEVRPTLAYGPFDANKLDKVVTPKFGAHATVNAAMARNGSRVHTGTKVTFHIVRGNPSVVEIAEIEKIPGVQRALWSKGGHTRLSFSLTDPRLENVDKVAGAVADLLGIYVHKPIDVVDPDLDAALYPEYDYRGGKSNMETPAPAAS
jgi:hypothetical protein